MGTRALIIAVSEGLPRHDLASQPIGPADASRQVAESVFPGLVGNQLPDGDLSEHCYPSAGVYVGTFGNTWLLASRHDALTSWAPTADGSGRNAYRVFIESIVSSAGFTYWGADGTFREFFGSWDDGVLESKGRPLPFEIPFWAGEMDDGGLGAKFHGDSMPFHPEEFGEEALREFFGIFGDGSRPDDLDADDIALHGFELRSPPRPKGFFARLRGRK